jgi:cytochrome c1
MIVGSKRFFRGGMDLTSPESEEEAVNLVSYLKSCGSGTQDLHESGRHSEGRR